MLNVSRVLIVTGLAVAFLSAASAEDGKPHGIEQYVPFTTSRVAGSPDPPLPSDIQVIITGVTCTNNLVCVFLLAPCRPPRLVPFRAHRPPLALAVRTRCCGGRDGASPHRRHYLPGAWAPPPHRKRPLSAAERRWCAGFAATGRKAGHRSSGRAIPCFLGFTSHSNHYQAVKTAERTVKSAALFRV